MNGTAAMTGLAVLAFKRAEYLTKLAARLTALTSIAIKGNPQHFDEFLFSVKPTRGRTRLQPVCARTWERNARLAVWTVCKTVIRSVARRM